MARPRQIAPGVVCRLRRQRYSYRAIPARDGVHRSGRRGERCDSAAVVPRAILGGLWGRLRSSAAQRLARHDL